MNKPCEVYLTVYIYISIYYKRNQTLSQQHSLHGVCIGGSLRLLSRKPGLSRHYWIKSHAVNLQFGGASKVKCLMRELPETNAKDRPEVRVAHSWPHVLRGHTGPLQALQWIRCGSIKWALSNPNSTPPSVPISPCASAWVSYRWYVRNKRI